MTAAPQPPKPGAESLTLDELFGAAAALRPDTIALVDPPNREAFASGPPRQLTYAGADRVIDAIAVRLRRDGLTPGAVVALQMPNTIEAVLALLGVLRAGLVASPLPLLWRGADCIAAVRAVGARAFITTDHVGTTDHVRLATDVAQAAPALDCVYALGNAELSVDALLAEPAEPPVDIETAGQAPAIITWDVTAAGLVPVGRTQAEVVVAGLEPMLEGRLDPDARILSSLCLGSLAGIAPALIAWLLTHGTLTLHHPFDPVALRRQVMFLECDTVFLPGSLAARTAGSGMFADSAVRRIIAVWRNPERLATSASWQAAWPEVMDVVAFGEAGLMAARRGSNGSPAGIIPGPGRRAADSGPVLIEAARTREGTVGLRGPMVPRLPVPPDAPPGAGDGFLDTGYPCRLAGSSGALLVTGPPTGVVSMGGYRFTLAQLQEKVAQLEPAAMLAAFPDALAGQRLAGIAVDRDAVRAALSALGFNPLVANAFRVRRSSESRDRA
jgi:hypothetical protein